MMENRLKWLGPVLKKEETVNKIYINRKRGRGRPKKGVGDVIKNERWTDVHEEDSEYRVLWKLKTKIRRPQIV